MHSWRTRILPGLSRDDLYKAYDFAEPWDSPKNKNVSSTRLDKYQCPSEWRMAISSTTAGTSYFAVVGPNAAWDGDKPRKSTDFGKEDAHTIMLVEVADVGVAWAEPKDLNVDTLGIADGKPGVLTASSNHRPPDGFFYTYDGVSGVNVATVEGDVCFLRTDNLSPNELRKILQIGGYTDAIQRSQGDRHSGWRPNWPNIAALAVWLVSVGLLLIFAARGRVVRLDQPPPPANEQVEPQA